MKTIIEQIYSLDKETAKDFKLIAENSLENVIKTIPNEIEMERLATIIETMIFACKQRVKEIAEKEMCDEFNNN